MPAVQRGVRRRKPPYQVIAQVTVDFRGRQGIGQRGVRAVVGDAQQLGDLFQRSVGSRKALAAQRQGVVHPSTIGRKGDADSFELAGQEPYIKRRVVSDDGTPVKDFRELLGDLFKQRSVHEVRGRELVHEAIGDIAVGLHDGLPRSFHIARLVQQNHTDLDHAIGFAEAGGF